MNSNYLNTSHPIINETEIAEEGGEKMVRRPSLTVWNFFNKFRNKKGETDRVEKPQRTSEKLKSEIYFNQVTIGRLQLRQPTRRAAEQVSLTNSRKSTRSQPNSIIERNRRGVPMRNERQWSTQERRVTMKRELTLAEDTLAAEIFGVRDESNLHRKKLEKKLTGDKRVFMKLGETSSLEWRGGRGRKGTPNSDQTRAVLYIWKNTNNDLNPQRIYRSQKVVGATRRNAK